MTDPATIGSAVFLGLVLGFLLALGLRAWADHKPTALEDMPPLGPPPRTVVERSRPVARHLVSSAYVSGFQRARGRTVKAIELAAVVEAGESAIDRMAAVLAEQMGRVYVDALVDFRRACARHSTLEPALVEQAILVALQRDARERNETPAT